MKKFYTKALEDEMLAAFFTDEISHDIEDEDWIHHIDLLADFWLTKLLGEDTYYGNFVGAHVKMTRIRPDDINRWLELFTATVDEVYTDAVAQGFKKKALQLVHQFINSKKNI